MPDLSLILNLHDEAPYLARTMRSAEDAARYAAASGISTELVIVLDAAAATTRQWIAGYSTDCFESIRRIEVQNDSLGPSRADGIRAARGEYFVLADGDDLMSFNSLAVLVETARAAGPDVIVIPEYLFEFGERYYIVKLYGYPHIGPLQALFAHPFVSRIMMRCDRFPEAGYRDVRLNRSYAYEDWHFNSDALARGMRFMVAPGTILFYRKRRTSLFARATGMSVGHIPPTRLADPAVLLDLAAADYADGSTGSGRGRRARLANGAPNHIRDFLSGPLCQELLRAANRIDPAVDPCCYQNTTFWSNVFEPTLPGFAYYRLCQTVGARRFTDVFLLPFMARGGGEKYLLNVMHGLVATEPDTAILVLTGHPATEHAWLDRLPAGTAFVDLCQIASECREDERDLITLKTIQAMAPGARIHLKHCDYTFRFWNRFGHALAGGNRGIFYRFMDVPYQNDGCLLDRGQEFDFISNHLDTLHLLIADNQQIIARDRERFGYRPEMWRWLPTECRPARSDADVRARAAGWRGRLLWASRLDEQKRPHLLPLIAAALRRRGEAVGIDVYGEPLLESFDLAALQGNGLHYRGSFNAFEQLDLDAYDGFIYTAAFDGLPNTLLEALGAGLPVIAPDIGGIPEVVVPGKTGWLVPACESQDALVDAFCDAVADLYRDADRHRRMALAAVELIVSRHGPEVFLQHVGEAIAGTAVAPPAGSAGAERDMTVPETVPPAPPVPSTAACQTSDPLLDQPGVIARLRREQQDLRKQMLKYAEWIEAYRGGQRAALASGAPALRTEGHPTTLQEELALAREWQEGIRRSRFYRLHQTYVGMYDKPVIGPGLRAVRRAAGRAMRSLRRA